MLKLFFKIVFVLLLALAAFTYFYSQRPEFGRTPTGKRLERIQQSPHYYKGRFWAIKPIEKAVETSQFEATMRFLFGGTPERLVPNDPMVSKKTDLKSLDPKQDVIVWMGHSTYYMQLNGQKILIDPVFSGWASPLPFINKAFAGSNIYTPEDIPDIDVLVISHDHWDHLDYRVVTELEPRVKRVVTGLGVGEHFEYWKYPVEKLTELDWWESVDLGEGFNVTATPARHFSGRDLHQNKTLWASFAFKSPKRTIWIGGDSGYGPHFEKIGKKFTDIDLAILENGQYDKDWSLIHTMPEYLGKEMVELGANRYMTVHHSKFCLSKHSYTEPLENAKRAAQESGKPVLMPQMGEVVYLE